MSLNRARTAYVRTVCRIRTAALTVVVVICIGLQMPDDELEREARSMELEAEAQGILVDGGILQAITRIRDDAQEEK